MDVNTLTEKYIAIREKRNELRRTYEEKDSAFKEKLEALEAQMLSFMHKNNMTSVKTEAGTFYRQENVIPSGSDWEALNRWVAENDAFDIYERRLKKTFVREYMDSHEGGLPPGVSVYREYVARVRRS